jgi:hypothetical protein
MRIGGSAEPYGRGPLDALWHEFPSGGYLAPNTGINSQTWKHLGKGG